MQCCCEIFGDCLMGLMCFSICAACVSEPNRQEEQQVKAYSSPLTSIAPPNIKISNGIH